MADNNEQKIDAVDNKNDAKAAIVDVKPKTEQAPARAITAEGDIHRIDETGDFIAKLHAGNIVIDPTLAQAAAKTDGPPPMTIQEALERGDYAAAARFIAAQIARAQNGDFAGMREEDRVRFGLSGDEGFHERERIRRREAELQQYYDANGGYRDRFGGYFNPNDHTYTDAKGGQVDDWGGYTYPDGSYKSKNGDYYDAPTNTVHLASGDTFSAGDMKPSEVRETMRRNVEDTGGYNKDYIRNAEAVSADREHPGPNGPEKGLPGSRDTPPSEVAANADANRGSTPSSTSGFSSRDAFFRRAGRPTPAADASTTVAPPASSVSTSRFPTGGTGTGGTSPSDVSNSSFFPVDSSISTSKFSSPADIAAGSNRPDDVDPAVTTRPRTPTPKSPSPN